MRWGEESVCWLGVFSRKDYFSWTFIFHTNSILSIAQHVDAMDSTHSLSKWLICLRTNKERLNTFEIGSVTKVLRNWKHLDKIIQTNRKFESKVKELFVFFRNPLENTREMFVFKVYLVYLILLTFIHCSELFSIQSWFHNNSLFSR